MSRVVEGELHFTVTNTFQPRGGWHSVHLKGGRGVGLGGIFGSAADPIVEKAQRRTARANLDTLAKLLADSQA